MATELNEAVQIGLDGELFELGGAIMSRRPNISSTAKPPVQIHRSRMPTHPLGALDEY
jgi:hypothetical protein